MHPVEDAPLAYETSEKKELFQVKMESQPVRFIPEFLLEGHLTLTEAHHVTDLIEEAIRKEIPGADITVHAEPLEPPPKPESAS